MRDKHEIVAKILDYREYAKLKSTYVEALPQQINPKTGRVHSSFNQVGTVTGRIASQNPNLQNIPTRTDLGQRVRQGFIAAPGSKLLALMTVVALTVNGSVYKVEVSTGSLPSVV